MFCISEPVEVAYVSECEFAGGQKPLAVHAGFEFAGGISACSGLYSAAAFSSNGQYEKEPYLQLGVAYVFGDPTEDNNCLGAGFGPGAGMGSGYLWCRTSVIYSRTYTGP
jgi:hypothetical protein